MRNLRYEQEDNGMLCTRLHACTAMQSGSSVFGRAKHGMADLEQKLQHIEVQYVSHFMMRHLTHLTVFSQRYESYVTTLTICKVYKQLYTLGNVSERSMSSLTQPSMPVSPDSLDCRWQPVQTTEGMQALLNDAPASNMDQSCIETLAHYHRCTAAVSHLKARRMDSFGSFIAPVSFH